MPIFVLHLSKVVGNRCANEKGLATVHHDEVLSYTAPLDGTYIKAYAVEADNMQAAMKEAVKGLSLVFPEPEAPEQGEPLKGF